MATLTPTYARKTWRDTVGGAASAAAAAMTCWSPPASPLKKAAATAAAAARSGDDDDDLATVAALGWMRDAPVISFGDSSGDDSGVLMDGSCEELRQPKTPASASASASACKRRRHDSETPAQFKRQQGGSERGWTVDAQPEPPKHTFRRRSRTPVEEIDDELQQLEPIVHADAPATPPTTAASTVSIPVTAQSSTFAADACPVLPPTPESAKPPPRPMSQEMQRLKDLFDEVDAVQLETEVAPLPDFVFAAEPGHRSSPGCREQEANERRRSSPIVLARFQTYVATASALGDDVMSFDDFLRHSLDPAVLFA